VYPSRHFFFTVRGSVDPFVKKLAEFALEEVTIEPPGLEEVFFEFYREDENSKSVSSG